MLRRVRLRVEYDGTRFNGWQVQANAPSVQEALENAIRRLTGERVRVRGAGRTDAGVHARGQVAVAALPASLPLEKIAEALNSRLPDSVAVTGASEASPAFDPRHDCVMKQYSYSLTLGPVRPALGDRRSWHSKRPVDVEAMAEAARAFEGTHDFTSFCNHELASRDNIRTIVRSALEELPPDRAGRRRVVYRVEGRSFLYNQVRAMAGTLLGIGQGRFPRDALPAMLRARDRAAAGESAPPWGLCLEWVLYGDEERPEDSSGLFD